MLLSLVSSTRAGFVITFLCFILIKRFRNTCAFQDIYPRNGNSLFVLMAKVLSWQRSASREDRNRKKYMVQRGTEI
jgi:hypothetical protein